MQITPRTLGPAILGVMAVVVLAGCGSDADAPPATTSVPSLFDGIELDESMNKTLIIQQIRAFAGTQGRNPETLAELVAVRKFKLPTPPAGMRWDYQPQVGSVELLPK